MDQLGNLLGILAAALFILALLNFAVKFVNRIWVAKLTKGSGFRRGYTAGMRFLVKNHRFFGGGAAVLMLAHIVLQLLFKWVSLTGVAAAVFAVAAVALGAAMYRGKKRSPGLLWAHRGAAIALVVLLVSHVITRI